MKFNLTCDLDNAAFDDCSGLELSRILGSVINKLEYISELTTDDHGKVKDMNGNTVCEWEVQDDSEPTDQEMMSAYGTKWHDGL